jgi:hypothetical protein
MKLKKLGAFAATLIISLTLPTMNPAAIATSKMTTWGADAVEQIATCINSSGQKDVVNVLFLIDESGSLDWNDPDNLRVEGIKATLDQFRSIAVQKPYFKVNRAITTFADGFNSKLGKPWQELTEDQLDDDKEWIDQKVPGFITGNSTNYLEGLRGAYDYFESQLSQNSCNVLVWFTDGAINLNDSRLTADGIAQICGINPTTGKKTTGTPIIDKFRKSGINIQGVLLRNEDYLEDPYQSKYRQKTGVTSLVVAQARAENESNGMTYFNPIVEYSGTVQAEYFGGSGAKDFKCGSPEGAKGVVTVVGDVIDIIWPPTEFECITSSGRVIPPDAANKVMVDPGFSRFRASAIAKGFELKNGAGKIIATGQGSSTEDVEVSFFGASDMAISVSGAISDASTVLKPGSWSFKTVADSEKVFCGYLDLAVEIKSKTCYEGETCSFEGAVTRNGRPVDFSVYKSQDLKYGLVNLSNGNVSYSNLSLGEDGKFKGNFNPAGFKDAEGLANLKVTLNVITQSGYKFTFSAIQNVQVLPPGLYPEILPNPVSKADFSQQLLGKNGKAIASLKLIGPSGTSGEICFDDLKVRTDPDPERVNSYQTQLDGEDLQTQQCFSLAANETKNVQLEIENTEAENGDVSGFLPVVLKSDGIKDLNNQVSVSFESTVEYNNTKRFLIFAVCLFLGLLIPLTALKILQMRNARIILSPLSKATTPVILSASGGFVTLKRAEKASGSEIFKEEDFEGFMHSEGKEKQLQIGSELLRGDAPLNPFSAPRAILSTTPGFVVASSDIWAGTSKGLDRHETTASLNPAFAMHLTLSETALAALKKQNQTGDQPEFPIEASLTGLLNFSGTDPVTQVNSLNMKLSTETGWLNEILKLEEPAEPKQKNVKEKKNKKVQPEVQTQPVAAADDWGSVHTSTSSNASTTGTPASPGIKNADDGWGNSSSSGIDDWGSSGTSGTSGSGKDDW